MKSRYDFMTESETVDPVSGSRYPDPLSLNYLNLTITDIPKKITMNPTGITHFWQEALDIYKTPELDDMVLTLNGVPHKNFLNAGDEIYFPSESDIKRSFMKERLKQ